MENSAVAPVTPASTGLRYGLLIGLIGIIISFIINALQLESSPLRYITWAVLLAGIIVAQRAFKSQNAGFMSYGQGLGVGMVVTLLYGALSGAFAYLYANFIDPEIVARQLSSERTKLEALGSFSDAQIDQAVAQAANFLSGPFIIAIVFFLSVVTGLLVSLITPIFIKNPKPEFE